MSKIEFEVEGTKYHQGQRASDFAGFHRLFINSEIELLAPGQRYRVTVEPVEKPAEKTPAQRLAKRLYAEGWRVVEATPRREVYRKEGMHTMVFCADTAVFEAMCELENPHLAEARQLFAEGWRVIDRETGGDVIERRDVRLVSAEGLRRAMWQVQSEASK